MSETYGMRRVLGVSFSIGLLVLVATVVFAQDAIEVASDQYEVALENDKVRVLRGRYAPGAKSAMHEHPGSVVVIMRGGRIRVTGPDGEMVDQFLQRGRVAWSGGAHEIENLGSDELEVVIVEVKNTSFFDRVFGD